MQRVALNPNFTNALLPSARALKGRVTAKDIHLTSIYQSKNNFFHWKRASQTVISFSIILRSLWFILSIFEYRTTVHHGIPELYRWGTKLYSQVSHSHHSHRCGPVQDLWGLVGFIRFLRVTWAQLLLWICSGDEVVVVIVVAVFVFGFEIFGILLRYVETLACWCEDDLTPCCPIWPCVLPGTDHHDERQTGCGGIQKSFRQTHGLLLAGLYIKSFELTVEYCWTAQLEGYWTVVLWYDLNWFDTVLVYVLILYCRELCQRPLLLNVMMPCYTLWQLQRRRGATVAPIQVDNPCFMVPMRTQRRQWREKEIERERGCWSVVCECNQYNCT